MCTFSQVGRVSNQWYPQTLQVATRKIQRRTFRVEYQHHACLREDHDNIFTKLSLPLHDFVQMTFHSPAGQHLWTEGSYYVLWQLNLGGMTSPSSWHFGSYYRSRYLQLRIHSVESRGFSECMHAGGHGACPCKKTPRDPSLSGSYCWNEIAKVQHTCTHTTPHI